MPWTNRSTKQISSVAWKNERKEGKRALSLFSLLEEQRRIVAHLEAVQEKVKTIKATQDRTGQDLRRLEGAILERSFRGEL